MEYAGEVKFRDYGMGCWFSPEAQRGLEMRKDAVYKYSLIRYADGSAFVSFEEVDMAPGKKRPGYVVMKPSVPNELEIQSLAARCKRADERVARVVWSREGRIISARIPGPQPAPSAELSPDKPLSEIANSGVQVVFNAIGSTEDMWGRIEMYALGAGWELDEFKRAMRAIRKECW